MYLINYNYGKILIFIEKKEKLKKEKSAKNIHEKSENCGAKKVQACIS